MSPFKTILITGSTDGIGLETAKMLVSQGHQVLLQGRNPEKLKAVKKTVISLSGGQPIEGYLADLSRMADVERLAKTVIEKHAILDVLINNAGVFNTPHPIAQNGLDVRFAVNTIAPYLLTQRLLPLMDSTGRVINLSSAAQSPVDLKGLAGHVRLSDMAAYSQSKLALTMWSRSMALSLTEDEPAIIAVNPGSMLGTKMVKDAFGVDGGDTRIGAEILTRAVLADEFSAASGQYFDNDSGRFAVPHPDALDAQKSAQVVRAIEVILGRISDVS